MQPKQPLLPDQENYLVEAKTSRLTNVLLLLYEPCELIAKLSSIPRGPAMTI
jgi:hypothetical protein